MDQPFKELQLAEDGLSGLAVTNYAMQSLFHNSVRQTLELYKPCDESANLKGYHQIAPNGNLQ